MEAGDIELLVVAGGDGLVHLAIQHLAETDVPMLLAPTGTGNDFATALGITNDPTPIEQQLTKPAHPVDLIAASTLPEATNGEQDIADRKRSRGGSGADDHVGARGSGRESQRNTVFIASIAIAGFPADINARANDMPLRLGSQIYTVAAALELPHFRRLRLELRVDDETLMTDTAMLAIGNTSLFGGGMLACPDATATDGYIHLTSIDGVGRLGILRHLKGRAGGTADRAEVIRRRAKRIEIVTPGVAIWGDGEPIAHAPLSSEVRLSAIKIVGINPK